MRGGLEPNNGGGAYAWSTVRADRRTFVPDSFVVFYAQKVGGAGPPHLQTVNTLRANRADGGRMFRDCSRSRERTFPRHKEQRCCGFLLEGLERPVTHPRESGRCSFGSQACSRRFARRNQLIESRHRLTRRLEQHTYTREPGGSRARTDLDAHATDGSCLTFDASEPTQA